MTNKVNINTTVEITATIQLTEGELRALDAMAGYGDDAFLRAFYIKLGKHYMKPFERDLRGLFARIRKDVNPALRGIEEARTLLAQKCEADLIARGRNIELGYLGRFFRWLTRGKLPSLW